MADAEPATNPTLTSGAGAGVQFVLASGSPRRLELLAEIGITPTVRVPDVDESRLDGESGAAMVERLSRAKAGSVSIAEDKVVIAADTIAVCGEQILGKPRDRHDAIEILGLLSGTVHHVLTGVCIRTVNAEVTAVESTKIRFRPLTRDEIVAYVDCGEAMGKAGAYAIQESGDSFVDEITGSRSNVVGLPLAAVVQMLGELGITVGTGTVTVTEGRR